MRAWNILIDGEIFDTVFFDDDCDKVYVYESLVNHDGFPSGIEIVEVD